MSATMVDERVYTTQEVAEIIRVHMKTVQRLIRRGELDAFPVGNEYRVTQSALDAFMHKRKDAKNTEGQNA